jgi:hypothetical protein
MSCSGLAKKLEAFTSQLDPDEHKHFRAILERGGKTEEELGDKHARKLKGASVAASAKKLDASLFHRLCDW